MSDWRPIETAPKDEKSILGYCPDLLDIYSCSPVQPVFWGTAVFPDSPEYGYRWFTDNPDQEAVEVTHWMPLPDLPKVKDNE